MEQIFHPAIVRLLEEHNAQRAETNAELRKISEKLERIAMSQSDIDNVTSQIEGEVTDLGNNDAAILAAQNAFAQEITTLQGQGVDTSKLVAAAQSLLTAQGADDSAVAALTAASQPAAPVTPAPAPAPTA